MPPKCPNGQRRNRVTGLCEGCPPGTRRQGRFCVPYVAGPRILNPVPPIQLNPYPPRPKRCPPTYTRSANGMCEKCPPNTKKNNLSRLCHPIDSPPYIPPNVAPIYPVPVQAPIPVQAPAADVDGMPLITYNRPHGVRCPPSTRRNRRNGLCEGCPRNTKRIRNKCYLINAPVAPVAPVAPAPVAPVAPINPNVPPTHAQLMRQGIPHNVATAMLEPDGFIKKSSEIVFRNLNNDQERRLVTKIREFVATSRTNQNNLKDVINASYEELKDFPFQNVSFQVYACFMRYAFGLLSKLQTNISDNLSLFYILLIKTFLEKALPYNSISINHFLNVDLFPLNTHFFVNRVRATPDLLEVFEDYGAYYHEGNGKLYLKSVTFIPYKPVVNKYMPVIPLPETMYDALEGGDVPMITDDPDNFYIVIQDNDNITGYVIPLDRLKMYISPRQPNALFMKCKAPIRGFYIGDDQVYNTDLYVELSKVGLPLRVYVNIDQIKSALDEGHNFIYLKPTIVNGAKLITQVATASLYKVLGINVVSRSHCEIGHVGGFYDVYLPA